METFHLDNHPHIALCDLLKILGWCESGGAAKTVIAAGEVTVDGQTETRKRCKIVAGQQVRYPGHAVAIAD